MTHFEHLQGDQQSERRRATSLAYKVEELLALRDSVSESAVSLDKFADEEVIKEHVLRPSASVNLINEKQLHPATTSAITLATNKKPSPSPSIKRGKAERLLKEHGSPPGMRVTAGGRIVPSDLPPLNGARFSSSTFRPLLPREVPSINTMTVPSPPAVSSDSNNNNNNLAQCLDYINGQPVLRLGDRIYALPTLTPSQTVPANVDAGLNGVPFPTESMILSAQRSYPANPAAQHNTDTNDKAMPASSGGVGLADLKARQESKKRELRTVEQTEVLQSAHQTDEWRSGMIQKKKSLILELDTLRKQISLVEAEPANESIAPAPAIGVANATGNLSGLQSVFVPQMQQHTFQPVFPNVGLSVGIPTANQYTPLLMYPPLLGAEMLPSDIRHFNRENQLFLTAENPIDGSQLHGSFPAAVKAPQSPGSATRRSHAIEIKPPRDNGKKEGTLGSTLDPKSPTYEPSTKLNPKLPSKQAIAPPPTPSPAKPSPWCLQDVIATHADSHARAISQKPSLSSIDTTDFFPTNTHEHSSTRIAPQKLMPSKQPSRETTALPSTPEKSWPASPWNPQPSSHGKSLSTAQRESAIRVASWAGIDRPNSSYLPRTDSKVMAEFGAATGILRNASTQQTSVDRSWPPIASKPIDHELSTYQEGYQAGYYHLGLPKNLEVLRGYVEGLLMRLNEGNTVTNAPTPSINSRASSLRDRLTGATLHDSAVSMAFPQMSSAAFGSENMRSASNTNPYPSLSDDAAYGLAKGRLEASMASSFGHENYARHSSMAASKEGADAADKLEYVFKHVGIPGGEPQESKASYVHPLRANSNLSALSIPPRQLSGNHMKNRVAGSPTNMQRYYPTPKEYLSGAYMSNNVSSTNKSGPGQRMSGLDGAMDDLAGLVVDTTVEDIKKPHGSSQSEVSTEVSCFRTSSAKGKHKAASPSKKSVTEAGKEENTSSPTKTPASPKKSSEHSPAKARLEQVTNKLRRARKDDPRNMSPEEKQERNRKWHKRFHIIRENEQKEIEEYQKNNPRKKPAGESGYK